MEKGSALPVPGRVTKGAQVLGAVLSWGHRRLNALTPSGDEGKRLLTAVVWENQDINLYRSSDLF